MTALISQPPPRSARGPISSNGRFVNRACDQFPFALSYLSPDSFAVLFLVVFVFIIFWCANSVQLSFNWSRFSTILLLDIIKKPSP